jgi:hypothetical protein
MPLPPLLPLLLLLQVDLIVDGTLVRTSVPVRLNSYFSGTNNVTSYRMGEWQRWHPAALPGSVLPCCRAARLPSWRPAALGCPSVSRQALMRRGRGDTRRAEEPTLRLPLRR